MHLRYAVLSSLAVVGFVALGPVSAASGSRSRPRPSPTPRPTLTEIGRRTLRSMPANQTESSFCYSIGSDAAIEGINANEPVRTASVMKTMTTMWAVEKLGPNYRFQTKIYYSPSLRQMHIVGGRDPYFDRDRTYLLLSDLDRLGFNNVTRLTADANFYFNFDLTEWQYLPGQAEGYYGSEGHRTWLHTPETELADLQFVFQPDGWREARADRYALTRRTAPASLQIQRLRDVNFHAESIELSDQNTIEHEPDVQIYTVHSRPLRDYVKIQNIHSINPMADELFLALGGAPEFRRYMHENFGISAENLADVHSGSGLEIYDGDRRVDTMLTCATVVTLLRRFDHDLHTRWHLDLSDVMMIASSDGGTWRRSSSSYVVKTGTLNNPGTAAFNLAGRNSTTTGEVYFGIFIQSNASTSRRISAVQDFTARMHQAQGVGEARPIEREIYHFHEFDESMGLTAASRNASLALIEQQLAQVTVLTEASVRASANERDVPRHSR